MIDERQVREMLERRAGAISEAPADAPKAIRRARRRLALNATVAGIMGLVVVAGAAAGVRSIQATPAPVKPATPPPAASVEPSVSVAPSPDMQPPFTERFDSPLHGLSIGYPAGWRTRAATEPWGRGELAFGASDVDVIFHPTLRDDLYFAVVSEPLGGKSIRQWGQAVKGDDPLPLLAFVDPGICTEPVSGAAAGGSEVDGVVGGHEVCISHVGAGHVVAVATATRGYIIHLHVGDDRRLQATYDQDWFQAALETVDLRPEDA